MPFKFQVLQCVSYRLSCIHTAIGNFGNLREMFCIKEHFQIELMILNKGKREQRDRVYYREREERERERSYVIFFLLSRA